MFMHICDFLRYDPARDLAAATQERPVNARLRGDRGSIQTEELGTRILLNMDTHGRRVVRRSRPPSV